MLHNLHIARKKLKQIKTDSVDELLKQVWKDLSDAQILYSELNPGPKLPRLTSTMRRYKNRMRETIKKGNDQQVTNHQVWLHIYFNWLIILATQTT